MNIALIGPSGVGKVTHAVKLAQRLSMSCCISGTLLRDNLQRQTAAGIMARSYMQSSNPVPDMIVDAIVEEWLHQQPQNESLLFVGYPRTAAQARHLDQLLQSRHGALDGVVNLQVSDDTVERRLGGRIVCPQCRTPYHLDYHPPAIPDICDHCGAGLKRRPEDIPELIKVRLRSFRRNINPMLAYYQQTGRATSVDAGMELDEVAAAVSQAAESLRNGLYSDQMAEPVSDTTDSPTIATATADSRAAQNAMEIVLLGGPGSGKGTQAEHLRDYLKLPHVATGDLFRDNLNNQTSLGRLAKSYMDRGALVPDDVTEAMVESRLKQSDTSVGFLLDGFPRNIRQARALDEIMHGLNRQLKCALYIQVSDEEIIRRLSGRLVCRQCQTPYHVAFKQPAVEGICDLCNGELYQRDDDNPDTVAARLQTFHEQTGPIINYYRTAGILSEINGEGAVDKVIQRSTDAINNLNPSRIT